MKSKKKALHAAEEKGMRWNEQKHNLYTFHLFLKLCMAIIFITLNLKINLTPIMIIRSPEMSFIRQ